MKKQLLKTFLWMLIGGSLLGGLLFELPKKVFAVSEETQNQIDAAEQEKEELEQELETQEQEKEELEEKKEEQQGTLEELKEEYALLASDIDGLNVETEKKNQEIAQTAKELEAAKLRQEQQYELMKKRIRYLYESPKENFLTLLLKNLSIADAINHIDNVQSLNEYDRKQLEEYEQEKENIGRQMAVLEEAKKELERLTAEVEEKQQQIVKLQKKASDRIAAYLGEIVAAEEEIETTQEALEAKSEALNELYEKARLEEEEERRRQAEESADRLQEALENGTVSIDDSGIVRGPLTLTAEEMDMLTAMIYCESRGEPYEGQLAVGHVIMNRVRSTKFPNSLEAVLRQSRQFEPAGAGTFDIVLQAYREQIPGVVDMNAWASCRSAAEECVNGESNVADCLFFRTHAPVPQLAENLKAAGVPYWIIQNHIFYYSWVSY